MDELSKLRLLYEEGQFLGRPIRFHQKYNVLRSDKAYRYKWIRTNKQLLKESRDLQLCLLDYAGEIDRGASGFYAITDNKTKQRYVAELVMAGKGFCLNELKGQYNQDAPKKLTDALRKQLKNINCRFESVKTMPHYQSDRFVEF
jgi:hypothetical protein